VDLSWQPPAGWSFYLFRVLPVAFGWPGLILSVAGLAVAWRRNGWIGVMLVGSAVGAFGVIALAQTLFVRYAAPVVAPLSIGLGLLLTALFARLGEGRWRGLRPVAQVAALLVVFFSPIATAVKFDRLLAAPDTRDLASRWVQAQAPGALALTQGWFAQVHLLPESDVAACAPEVPPWLKPGVPAMPGGASTWPAAIARGDEGWATIAHEATEKYISRRSRPEEVELVIGGYALLPCGLQGRKEVRPLDPDCFELVQTFSPGVPSCDSYLDMFDAFWVPYSGFRGQYLPGPEIKIWKNRCYPWSGFLKP